MAYYHQPSIKCFQTIARSDVDSTVVYGILPPAEAGGWHSSTRLVNKILNQKTKMGSKKKKWGRTTKKESIINRFFNNDKYTR
mmetsp:Transcript_26940/g.42272  ORF Transcript_26940/g.42272 Transcript_26940/m.42272 type:complete len:83 (-) Transcript_26940:23-271(-)